MLRRMFRTWRSAASRSARMPADPRELHLDILYRDFRVGDHPLVELVRRTLAESNAAGSPGKLLHRPLAQYFLAQYFLHTLDLAGDRAECGVFQGTSALFLCYAARTRKASYAGEQLHLIDSFEGLSAPGAEDAFEIVDETGKRKRAVQSSGTYAAPLEVARNALRAFPAATFHRGWIPAVFAGLPEKRWSFVHIDVDLYEPTHGALGYFYPRLLPGGVIVCDDYGSPTFPGAKRAWDRYCGENGIGFVVLDTGQSVLLKPDRMN